MEEAGIITGFHVAELQQPTLTECYCVAGEWDLLIKVVFESVEQLQ
jgi:DNA-binding Lrp family transcriptional regulator